MVWLRGGFVCCSVGCRGDMSLQLEHVAVRAVFLWRANGRGIGRVRCRAGIRVCLDSVWKNQGGVVCGGMAKLHVVAAHGFGFV